MEWTRIYDNVPPEYGNKTGVPYLRASQERIEIYCCQIGFETNDENNDIIPLIIAQDLKKGLGGVVWDCGMVMIDFLNHNPQLIRDKVCVDLGCGTGVVGLCASHLGSTRTILCDNVEYSVVHENMRQIQSRGLDCNFCLYDWGTSLIPIELQSFLKSSATGDCIDTLLGSDILYAPECYPQLEQTLHNLRFHQLIITYKRRHDEREKEFLQQLQQTYRIQVLELSDITLQSNSYKSNSTSASRAGVHILLLTPQTDQIG